MSCDGLLVGNDNIIEAVIRDPITGAYVNSATVTAVVVDAAGVEVSGDTWPKTMAYVNGSSGVYRGTLLKTLGITAGRTYRRRITAVSGAFTGFWENWVKARTRTG